MAREPAQPATLARPTRWLPAVIIAAILAAYLDSFAGAFVFDDRYVILDNPTLRHPLASWKEILTTTRPLATLTLAANYVLGGTDVRGYHAVNLAIHLAAALAFFGLVRRTLLLPAFQARYERAAPWLALAAALLWGLHPLDTQAVTYIVQRSEALMGLFYFLTLYGLVRGATAVPGRESRWYAAAVLACALGMGSKEVMVTAPVTALLYDRVFLAPSWSEVFRRRGKLYAALAGTWILLWGSILSAFGLGPSQSGGAGFGLERVSAREYALSQPGVILHYLRLAFWPLPLCLDYGWPVARTAGAVILPGLAVLAILGLTLAALRRRPALGFLGTAFFLILAPTSSILPILDLAVEHRMYLPLAPLVVAVVMCGHSILRHVPGPPMRFGIAATAVAAAVVALGTATWRRNQDYRDELGLWTDITAKRPANPRAHMARGVGLGERDRLTEAVREYQEAIRLKPDYVEAYNNLGIALARLGRRDEAVTVLRAALEKRPSHARAHVNLGKVLLDQGKVRDAVAHFREAVRLQPDSAEAHLYLGKVHAGHGDLEGAATEFSAALASRPDFHPAANELGIVLSAQGRFEQAIPLFAEVVRSDPRFAEGHNNLGMAYLMNGQLSAAVACFRQAVALEPASGKYAFNLAHALTGAGDAGEARTWYDRALRLDPGWPRMANQAAWNLAVHPDPRSRNGAMAQLLAEETCEATHFAHPDYLDTLGAAYAAVGRYSDAIAILRRALQMIPPQETSDRVRAMQARLRLYERHKAYREAGSAGK